MDVLIVLLLSLLIFSYTSASPICGKGAANIGTGDGVHIEAVNGSRVEMGPLTKSKIIKPGSTISITFRPESASGLIFAALDSRSNDMVAAYIYEGHLAFARRCQRFYYVGIGKRLQRGRWHTVYYHHSSRGGTMNVDGSRNFRQYHMWGCQNLSQLYFGGLPQTLKRKVYWKEAKQQFSGCLKDVKLDGTFPDVSPRYRIISSCQTNIRNHINNRPSQG